MIIAVFFTLQIIQQIALVLVTLGRFLLYIFIFTVKNLS